MSARARRLVALAAHAGNVPWAVPAAVGAGIVVLAFSAGGFFPADTALAAVVAAIAFAGWSLLARRPWDGLARAPAIAVGALVALAAWALLSQAWSHAPLRALLEFDRTLFYALAVALCAAASASAAARAWMPRAIALALAGVAICGLVTRLLPRVWPTPAGGEFERLSYPLTYWNAMGLLTALAIVACVHLASSRREHVAVRALAAAAIVPVSVALLLTFSRAGLALAPLAVLAYLLLARPPGAAPALLAIAPPTGVALAVAYGADAVVKAPAPTDAAIAQGRTVFVVVAVAAAVAGVLLVALRPLEARVARWRPPQRTLRVAGAALAGVVLAGAVVSGLPQRAVERVAHAEVSRVAETGDSRDRLTDLGDNGRLANWRVALDATRAEPLLGTGAGTYALQWVRDRDIDQDVTDAHSVWLETAAELGIPGLLLLVAAIGALAVGCAARIRGPDRALGAAALTMLAVWVVHAGVDWDWEMPAVTLPALAMAACASAGRTRELADGDPPGRSPWWPRLAVVALVGAIALTPLSVARAQPPLDDALAAVRAGDCRTAAAKARESLERLSIRPQAHQILAVCELRAGRGETALAHIRAALDLDPQDWRLRYDLAVVRAVNGLDPRPALADARARNPRSWLLRIAQRETRRAEGPDGWREWGLGSTLLL